MLRSSTTSFLAFRVGTHLLVVKVTEIRVVILFTYLALAFVDTLALANLTHAPTNGQDAEEKKKKIQPAERIRKENGKKRIC